MKVVEEYWKCDVCGQKIGIVDNGFLKVKVPARKYDCEGKQWSKGFAEIDLCHKCGNAFWDISDTRFATVTDYYSISAVKHYEHNGGADND